MSHLNNEPPHQDLRFLEIPLFSSQVLKELKHRFSICLFATWAIHMRLAKVMI